MEREHDIRKFVPEEYWTILSQNNHLGMDFEAPLTKKNGEKFVPKNEADARKIAPDRSRAKRKRSGSL